MSSVLATARRPSPWVPRPHSPSASPPGRHPVPPPPPAPARRRVRRRAALPGPVAAGPPAGRRPPRADDARGEDRPDDPGRARQRRRRHHEDHHRQPRQRAVRRRLGADAEHPDGLGRHGRPLPGRGPEDPARHPADLRHRHRPRRRQHVRRHGLPPQHRPRRHARPGAGPRRRAHRRLRDPVERTAVGVRPLRLRGARRPLGSHYESFGETPALVEKMETAIDGFQGKPGHLVRQRPGAGHRQALRRRRPHDVRHRLQQASRPAPTRSTRASTRSTTRPSAGWRWRRTSRR